MDCSASLCKGDTRAANTGGTRMKDVAISFLAGAMLFGLVAYGMIQFQPPEQAIAVKIDSMDEVKLNHMLEELSAQERQLSAIEKDIQNILVEITKIRKEKK
jgi:hypothetical protein